MQAVIALPDHHESKDATDELLFREICGIPLLVRTIATAARAGAHQVLLIFAGHYPSQISRQLCESKLLSVSPRLEFVLVPGFDPSSPSRWEEIAGRLEHEFLWLPWNWVTNKHSLHKLPVLEHNPGKWNVPARLRRDSVFLPVENSPAAVQKPEGIAAVSESSVNAAERWLVANSGKPLDGIYTSFNRRLCRPLVRTLTHTRVTPNAVTVVGLLVGIVSAYCFSKGFYLTSVLGALLFFLSGLCDEVDGMLARLKFSDSPFGTWFEGYVDNLSYLLLFGGIAIGLYRRRGPQELWIGGAILVGAMFSVAVISWLRKRSTHADRPNEYLAKMYGLLDKDRANWISRVARNVEFLLKKGVFVHYVVLFSLLGLLPVMMRLAAFAANLTWILALYFSRRFFRSPRPIDEAVQFQQAAKVNL